MTPSKGIRPNQHLQVHLISCISSRRVSRFIRQSQASTDLALRRGTRIRAEHFYLS
jgi:hypothetical protein